MHHRRVERNEGGTEDNPLRGSSEATQHLDLMRMHHGTLGSDAACIYFLNGFLSLVNSALKYPSNPTAATLSRPWPSSRCDTLSIIGGSSGPLPVTPPCRHSQLSAQMSRSQGCDSLDQRKPTRTVVGVEEGEHRCDAQLRHRQGHIYLPLTHFPVP